MFTVDRINRLLGKYDLADLSPHYMITRGSLSHSDGNHTWNPTPGHKVMDTLDVMAGIETGGVLGERVTRHEEQLTWRRFIR